MALLSSRFRLFDLEDVEGLVVAAIGRSPHVGNLSPDDWDDLVAAGIAAVWKASTTWEAGRGKFSTVAWVVAQRTVVDSLRSRYRTVWKFSGGRTYERPPRPEFVSYEHEFASHKHANANGSASSGDDERPSRRLGRALAELSVDAATSSDPALARILATRTSATPPDDHPLHRRRARRAAG